MKFSHDNGSYRCHTLHWEMFGAIWSFTAEGFLKALLLFTLYDTTFFVRSHFMEPLLHYLAPRGALRESKGEKKASTRLFWADVERTSQSHLLSTQTCKLNPHTQFCVLFYQFDGFLMGSCGHRCTADA